MKRIMKISCLLLIAGIFNSLCIAGNFPDPVLYSGQIKYNTGYSFQKNHIGTFVKEDNSVTELTSIMLLVANDSVNSFRADSAAEANPNADTVFAEGADIAKEVYGDYSTAGNAIKTADFNVFYADIQEKTLVYFGVYLSSESGKPIGFEYFNGMDVETYFNNNPVLHFVDLSRAEPYTSPVNSSLTMEKEIFRGTDGCYLKDISYNSKSIGLLYYDAKDQKEYKVYFK